MSAGPSSSSRLALRGADSLKHVDQMLRKLETSQQQQQQQRNVPPPRRVSSATADTSGPNSSSTSTSSSQLPPRVKEDLSNATSTSVVEAPLSSAAASLVVSIESFDLFSTHATSSGVPPRASSSSVPQMVRSAASGAVSSAVGSDEPLPRDGPPMSDAVMMQYSNNSDVIVTESKVTYLGRSSSSDCQNAGSVSRTSTFGAATPSPAFTKRLGRATQRLYFDELMNAASSRPLQVQNAS